jgi:hypothetical protein
VFRYQQKQPAKGVVCGRGFFNILDSIGGASCLTTK